MLLGVLLTHDTVLNVLLVVSFSLKFSDFVKTVSSWVLAAHSELFPTCGEGERGSGAAPVETFPQNWLMNHPTLNYTDRLHNSVHVIFCRQQDECNAFLRNISVMCEL